MAGRDRIVVGTLAGGIHALQVLTSRLPSDLPAAVFVVLHLAPEAPSSLARILNRTSSLPIRFAQDGERIQEGVVYLATPDSHLILKNGVVNLTRGPRENGFRPSVDVLFRTAARAYGKRVVGVILSGALDDGVAGLQEIKRYGGMAVVQNPEEAELPSMPLSAIKGVEVDEILSVSKMAGVLLRLAREPVSAAGGSTSAPRDVAEEGSHRLRDPEDLGPPSAYTCPECGGALWEGVQGNLVKYRCHVGHGYSLESLVAEQSRLFESDLWRAIRSAEENAALCRRIAEVVQAAGQEDQTSEFRKRAGQSARLGEVIRSLTLQLKKENWRASPATSRKKGPKAVRKAVSALVSRRRMSRGRA